MNKFGERLRAERESINLTRNELAKRLNVSVRTISYWENGQRECDFDTLIKLATILETSTDYLLGKIN
ncbi:MAG: helix-turn-helix transcriptional regulator [Clostridia bacterium]|nr:helix-turn-helix transcriptional regulator [Clostridia bacterium]